ADLAIDFEASDARTVASARINHNEGSFHMICRLVVRRHYPYQPIVHWARQVFAGHHHFGKEIQNIWNALSQMRLILVAALAYDVCVKDTALPGVNCILCQSSKVWQFGSIGFWLGRVAAFTLRV